MTLLVFSRYDRIGASSRLRMLQFLPSLAEADIHATVSPLFDEVVMRRFYASGRKGISLVCRCIRRRLSALRMCRRFDLVWIEKEILPFMPAWPERQLVRNSVPYVADYDDAVFHDYDLNRRRIVRKLMSDKIPFVMRAAKTVTVGNQYLFDYAKAAGASSVELLPTVVDLVRYSESSRGREEDFTIGWIGTPVTCKYLGSLQAVFRRLCQDDKTRLLLVGAGPVTWAGVKVESVPWSEETEAQSLARIDVGIMPLPDEPWERGKCGYKLIQYMACGKPVVASPVGANQTIVRDGSNGFLAATSEEWFNRLCRLREDHKLRETMGRQGRQDVERSYCLEATAPRLANVLRGGVGLA